MQVSTKLTFIKGGLVGNQGANSDVFFARDPQLEADLVMKQVRKASIADPAKYFSEASRLYDARHPNVVDVKYACEDQDFIYLAMPKYQGSVHAVLTKRFLTVREVVTLGFDFLSGLHHVHTKGLLHFDVKPSNVLLNDAGRAALADFGLTQRVDMAGLATPEKLYGKQWPPEALTSSPSLAVTSDIYQAGFTLYRMANGLAPVETAVP